MWCEGINWNKADREQWRAAQLHFLNTRNCRLNSSLSPALPPCNWSHQKSLEPLERSERQSVPCPSSHPIPSSVTGLTQGSHSKGWLRYQETHSSLMILRPAGAWPRSEPRIGSCLWQPWPGLSMQNSHIIVPVLSVLLVRLIDFSMDTNCFQYSPLPWPESWSHGVREDGSKEVNYLSSRVRLRPGSRGRKCSLKRWPGGRNNVVITRHLEA